MTKKKDRLTESDKRNRNSDKKIPKADENPQLTEEKKPPTIKDEEEKIPKDKRHPVQPESADETPPEAIVPDDERFREEKEKENDS